MYGPRPICMGLAQYVWASPNMYGPRPIWMGLAQHRLIKGKGLSKVMESIYTKSNETGLAQSEDASPKALTSPNQSSINTNKRIIKQ